MALKPCPFCGAPMTLAADGSLWAWLKNCVETYEREYGWRAEDGKEK